MKIWIILTALAVVIAVSIFFTASVSDRSAEVEQLLGKPASAPVAVKSSPALAAPQPPTEARAAQTGNSFTDSVADHLGITRQFQALANLPAGEQAITLGQQLENSISPANTSAYMDALLTTDHPAVERTAQAALSRSADADTIMNLVRRFGSTPEDRRGRILQVMENAQNPLAAPGLIEVVQSDTSEKRSPLLTSAMNGLAGLGTTESVGFLIRQVATGNETFALMSLDRVSTEQGKEMIRAAAAGNKDSEGIPPELLAALGLIVTP